MQLDTKVRILEDKERNYRQLASDGAIAVNEWKGVKNELELARQSRDVQQSQVDYYEVQVNIKSGDLASSTVNNDRALMQEIVDKDKSIQELEKEVEKMEKRLNFQTVIAPVDGIVQDIGVNTVGSVVSSEKPIVTIVPADTKLVLEAFVLNRDIGYVKVGQKDQTA